MRMGYCVMIRQMPDPAMASAGWESALERNLFKYIWKHSKAEQVSILILVLVSMPFYFLSLNVPKLVINTGILGEGFQGPGSTLPFMTIDLPFSDWFADKPIVLFKGFEMEQPGLLLALSFTFFGLVLVNGLFKFLINTRKGRMGERMLRRLRFELGDRILRFPLMFLRRVKQSEMATMIKDEVEPLGGFIGDAFVTPAFLGGQAITAMVFIMVQSFWLGIVAATIVLIQAFLIPKLRKRILVLGRERQLTARQLAGRIGELVEGAVEIQAHDTTNLERADLASRLAQIFYIRYEIFQRKFFVKFLNNLLSQFTPFIFYAGGGLLAIYGHLDIGALVAVIGAYKDLPGPVKELIDWDQQRADVQIKYDQVIEQFQPPYLIEAERQDIDNDGSEPLSGDLVLSAVTLVDDNDFKLLDGISFSSAVNQHLAIVGPSGSGKEQVSFVVSGLVPPSSGSVRIGNRDLDSLPSAVTGRRIAFVGQDVYHFAQSVKDNLLYGLKHRPLREQADSSEEERQRYIAEAKRSGNPGFDPKADWVDYDAAGAEGPAEITARLIDMLSLVELEEDVYRLGLTGTLDPKARPEAAKALLEARQALLERLTAEGAEDLVERFSVAAFNRNATLGENLLFGTTCDPAYRGAALANNPILRKALADNDLVDSMERMGLSIAKTMVEIFADLPPGHPFFEQFSFISDDDLPEFTALVSRSEGAGIEVLSDEDRERLLSLPFDYTESRHRLGLIDESVEQKLLKVRAEFAKAVQEKDPGAVEFIKEDAYNGGASLQDNILFGRVAHGRAQARETIGRAITEVLDTLGLRETVIEIGLDYQVGVGGKRLSGVQRQKLGLARALLKQPDLLVINEAVAVMDGSTQARLLDKILEQRQGRGVVWTLQRPSLAQKFQRVVVLNAGRVVEEGNYEDLDNPGSAFTRLTAAE